MSDMPPPPPPPDEGGSPSFGSSPSGSGDPYGYSQTRPGWSTLGTGRAVELANPASRLGARIIDVLLVVVGGIAITSVAGGIAGAVLTPLGYAAYEISMISLRGQTLGKIALNIKVVGAADGELPGWGKAVGRWAVPNLVGIVPLIGTIITFLVYLSLVWDGARQGWHDKAAKTLVIKT